MWRGWGRGGRGGGRGERRNDVERSEIIGDIRSRSRFKVHSDGAERFEHVNDVDGFSID